MDIWIVYLTEDATVNTSFFFFLQWILSTFAPLQSILHDKFIEVELQNTKQFFFRRKCQYVKMWRCKNKAENLTDWTGDLNIFYVTSELKRIFIKSGDRFFGVFLCFTPNSLSYPFRELIHWYLSFPAMCPALLRSGKECAQLVCAWLLNGTSTWRPWALVLGHETWGQGWLRRLNRSTYSV